METGEMKKESSFRAEIDTSAPFESVKEAASRFGGIGYWKGKPHRIKVSGHELEEIRIMKVVEDAAQLEKDLIIKERETMEVLKELETTKNIVQDLKVKLQSEGHEVNVLPVNYGLKAENENTENVEDDHHNAKENLSHFPSSAPCLILMELKQAKLNLTKTSIDLDEIRASVESLKKQLEKERNSLEKTRDRLTLKSSKISSLEDEFNKTRLKLQLATGELKGGSVGSLDISREIQRLSSEAEEFKNLGEAARLEVLRAITEIEETKAKIKTAEIRLVAARKMKKAARAAEAVLLADINARQNHDGISVDIVRKPDGLTLSFEEYSSLTSRAREAESVCNRRVFDAMVQVDEANVSKAEILKSIEETSKEIKTGKTVMEDALNRVRAANSRRVAVEEALRKRRYEYGQKRSNVHNSTKFKNPYYHRDSGLIDVNGMNLISDKSMPVLKPTLSIGQILSRKLLLPEEFEMGIHGERSNVKRNSLLSHMLNSQSDDDLDSSQKVEREMTKGHKHNPGKRKKFGFARFSLLLTKRSKRKKKTNPTLFSI